MMSTNFWDFLTPPLLSAFGTDLLYYKIHATSLTICFSLTPSPFDADIISGSPLRARSTYYCDYETAQNEK